MMQIKAKLLIDVAACDLLEHAMPMTRLEQEPDARSRMLAELMGLAAAMESEAIQRYRQLAAEMSRRQAARWPRARHRGKRAPPPPRSRRPRRTAPPCCGQASPKSERLYDIYADLADRAGTETVLLAAQHGARRAVRHIATLVVRLHASGS
jgi:hypothetical protein